MGVARGVVLPVFLYYAHLLSAMEDDWIISSIKKLGGNIDSMVVSIFYGSNLLTISLLIVF